MARRKSSKKPSRQGGAKTAKREALDEALASSPRLQAIHRNLRSEEPPIVMFASTADRRNLKDIEREIIGRLEPSKGARLTGIGLDYRFDHSWEFEPGCGCLNIKALLKSASSIKKSAPHSISYVVTCCVPADANASGWLLMPGIATLILSFEEGSREYRAPRPVNVQSESSSAQRRPTLAPCWIPSPTDDDVARVVGQFIETPARLRSAATEQARQCQNSAWRTTADARRMATFQMAALLPLSKAFFGAGQGDVILRYALTNPLARARQAKKSQGAIGRDELVYLIAVDAHLHQRVIPAFVRM